jgi:hypothetical protein
VWTFGHPACVLLEGEPQDADLLVCDGVEERLHDAARESRALEVVEGDDLGPVLSHLGQVQALAAGVKTSSLLSFQVIHKEFYV